MHKLRIFFLCFLSFIPLQALASTDNLVVQPFPKASISQEQRDAWKNYIKFESSHFGCSYGDDSRLDGEIESLLIQISEGKNIEPVQMTYRTYLNLPDSVRDLMKGHIKIASMDCMPVYIHDGKPIGMILLPFEEMFDLLINAYQENDRDTLKNIITYANVAPIDPRWFYAFFVMPETHISVLGYDADSVKDLNNNFPATYDGSFVLEKYRHLKDKWSFSVNSAYNNFDYSTVFFSLYTKLMGANFYLPLGHECEYSAMSVPAHITVTPNDDAISLVLEKSNFSSKEKYDIKNAYHERVDTESDFVNGFTGYFLNKVYEKSDKGKFIEEQDYGLTLELRKYNHRYAYNVPGRCS